MTLDKAKVERFIASAMKYKGDKYSQPKRLEKGFSDCSSLIEKALNDLNLNTRKGVAVTTNRMGIVGDSRFKLIPKSEMRRGDILWGGNYIGSRWEGHVAIYLGDGKTLEARVKEGVDYNKDRAYFTRVYRIVALEETKKPAKEVIENVPIIVNGKTLKTKGYIVDGRTYVDIDSIAYPVRRFFEGLGCDVKWIDGKVVVTI